MRISDWSSDVCSSDLPVGEPVTTPGLHWKLPFIQDVRRFDKRLLVWDGDVNQIPTLGREFVIVDTTARWRISDPLMFLRSVRDERGARTRIDDIIDSVVRDIISGTNLEEIVRSHDRSEEHTSELQSLMRISYAVFCLNKKTSYVTHHTR